MINVIQFYPLNLFTKKFISKFALIIEKTWIVIIVRSLMFQRRGIVSLMISVVFEKQWWMTTDLSPLILLVEITTGVTGVADIYLVLLPHLKNPHFQLISQSQSNLVARIPSWQSFLAKNWTSPWFPMTLDGYHHRPFSPRKVYPSFVTLVTQSDFPSTAPSLLVYYTY